MEEKIDTTQLYEQSYFSDEYFQNNKVGVIARESFSYLLNNELLSENDIKLLKTQSYSSKTFGVWLPLFETDENKLYDGKKFRRYYKEPISTSGEKIYLCREWFDRCKDKHLLYG